MEEFNQEELIEVPQFFLSSGIIHRYFYFRINMSNKLVLSLLCVSSYVFSMIELDKKSVRSPKHLKNIMVLHKEEQLYVQEGDKKPVLVSMFDKNLKKGLALKIKDVQQGKSFLFVDEINGQYKIDLKEKLKGSGPILAWWGYVATKSVLYGLGLVGIGAGIGATGGAVGIAAGSILGATTIGGTGAGIVAGAIGCGGAATAGITAGSVVGTGAVVGATGGSWALITGGIEVVSMGVGGLLGMIPFL